MQQRAFRGGLNVWIRSRYDDPENGKQALLERAEIGRRETLDLGSPWPESKDLLRSRTVAFTVTIDEPPDLLQLVTMDGAELKLIRERVVVHHPDMGGITWWRQDYEAGTHKIAFAYDRDHFGPADKGKFWAAINGKAGSWGGGQPLLRADQAGSLVLGGEQAMQVENVRIWDRALSQSELEQVTR